MVMSIRLYLIILENILVWCEQLQIYSRVTKSNNTALEDIKICYLPLFYTEWL